MDNVTKQKTHPPIIIFAGRYRKFNTEVPFRVVGTGPSEADFTVEKQVRFDAIGFPIWEKIEEREHIEVAKNIIIEMYKKTYRERTDINDEPAAVSNGVVSTG